MPGNVSVSFPAQVSKYAFDTLILLWKYMEGQFNHKDKAN